VGLVGAKERVGASGVKQPAQHFDVCIAMVRRAKPCVLCGEDLIVGDVAEVRPRGGAHLVCAIAERRGH